MDNRDSILKRLCQALDPTGGTLRFSALLITVGVTAHFLSEGTVRPTLAIALLAACLANVGRIIIHIRPGDYFWLSPTKIRESSKPAVRVHLSALVVTDISLTLSGLAGSVILIDHPEAPLLWRVIPACILCLAFYVVALATVDRANELGLKRGTEIVRESNFGGWLFKIGRNGSEFRPVKWLLDLFDHPTKPWKASTLSLLIATTLLFVPAAAVVIELSLTVRTEAITTMKEWVEGGGEKEDGEATSTTEESVSDGVPVGIGLDAGAAAHLHLTISKTDLSDPGTEIPLDGSDLPYILVGLPLILRGRQLAESSGRTWAGGSIYMIRSGMTLTFQVVDQKAMTAVADLRPAPQP